MICFALSNHYLTKESNADRAGAVVSKLKMARRAETTRASAEPTETTKWGAEPAETTSVDLGVGAESPASIPASRAPARSAFGSEAYAHLKRELWDVPMSEFVDVNNRWLYATAFVLFMSAMFATKPR